MSWDIVYTAQARQDLRDIYEYIALELLAPENAAGQTQRIMKTIHSEVHSSKFFKGTIMLDE